MRACVRALLPALLLYEAPAATAGPIIDVHRHTGFPGEDDVLSRTEMLANMDEDGIVLAVLALAEEEDVEHWIHAAPDRFLGGTDIACPTFDHGSRYSCFPKKLGWADVEWIRTSVAVGDLQVLHEFVNIYRGMSPADPRLDSYWALAAELDLPVGIHVNRGPPPNSPFRPEGCCPAFNSEMGNPELLRPVLEKYPGLRIWLEHVGAGGPGFEPFMDETIALLRDYPNVHLDLTITNSIMPKAVHEEVLRRLIDSGFGDRIMFGTDNLPAGPILQRLSEMDWLTEQQRRDILYNNAARFFRLSEDMITRHGHSAEMLERREKVTTNSPSKHQRPICHARQTGDLGDNACRSAGDH